MLDDDGRILTNAHVVDDATAVRVTFSGTHTRPAPSRRQGPTTDLALLQVDPEGIDLRPLELGRLETPSQVGDPTVAIGNPFGLDRTLTTGVVSALQRRITAPDGYTIENVIQTDAALNPGNSGGPLIDAGGRVIGINSQIATGGGGNGSVGIGFAVPIDTAKEVVAQLKARAGGRPWLRLDFGRRRQLPRWRGRQDGLLVQTVKPGAPGRQARACAAATTVTLTRRAAAARRGRRSRRRRPGRRGSSTRSAGGHEPGDTVGSRSGAPARTQSVEVDAGQPPAPAARTP